MTPGPILFVSHDASPTGAPFVLLHLLRWLRGNTNLDFHVALNATGTLESQFAELAPVAVFRREPPLASRHVLGRLAPYRATAFVNSARFRRALGTDRF